MQELFEKLASLEPEARALHLEKDEGIRQSYELAARQGRSAAPDPEEEVEYHYICYVRSSKNGDIYHMDGDLKGPVRLGTCSPDGELDLLKTTVIDQIKDLILSQGRDIRFNILSLGP